VGEDRRPVEEVLREELDMPADLAARLGDVARGNPEVRRRVWEAITPMVKTVVEMGSKPDK
jgi:hypothetical protein